MAKYRTYALAIGAAAAIFVPACAADLFVEGPVGDGAVLQRDRELIFTGGAPAGASVSIALGPHRLTAAAGGDGRWSARTPAMSAGGPYTLQIESDGAALNFEDVHLGDVWLCSGQSNMEYPVYRALNPDTEIAGPHDSRFRLLTIPQVASPTPLPRLAEGARWIPAAPDAVRDFSALCYFTARALYADQPIAVGLIDASWGGSQIEAWLPAASLAEAGPFAEPVAQLELYKTDKKAAMRAYGASWEAWHRGAYGAAAPWTGDDAGLDWRPAPDAMGDWKTYGDQSAKDHYGNAWFRKRIVLTDDEVSRARRISLGEVDEVDIVWINGRVLGSTFGWGGMRRYELPGDFLKAGENLIVVNVLNTYGRGGMLGPREDMALEFEQGPARTLAGDWEYAVAPNVPEAGPRMPWEDVRGLTTIHNGMIAPLGSYAMRGALWYQGESNTDHPATYEALLTKLLQSWRQSFGADLAAVIVQLPGYGAMPAAPVSSGWSIVREAARRVAIADPLAGLVVAIDAGDRDDLHPPNKQLVAKRAAAVAKALFEGDFAAADGVTPVSAVRRGRKAVLTMSVTGLQVVGARAPIAFELCDEAGACAWADARLDGAEIVLEAREISAPVEARYCQGDAPICNLYSENDLPVSPFVMTLGRE